MIRSVIAAIKNSYKPLCKQEGVGQPLMQKKTSYFDQTCNEFISDWVWDQSRSKYYLRTKFQDGIDKPQKCRNACYHPTHQQQSDFLILVLYDFIVQNILSSLLLLCYNLMIMNKLWINYKYSFYPSFIIWNTTNKTEM